MTTKAEDTVKVKALTDHRHGGVERKEGQTYELERDHVDRAIAEGWVVPALEKKK